MMMRSWSRRWLGSSARRRSRAPDHPRGGCGSVRQETKWPACIVRKRTMNRRGPLLLALVLGALALPTATARSASDDAAWDALRAGGIALFRHANAPGVGDPPGMRLD